ncbi:MAG: hypothetical protein IPJ37_03825 [Bacteroidales bacterium]|nr:hypothetical protein [Bacteroidales bacterium]
MAAENYQKPYPRPFPCGSVLLGFDLRNAELLGHKLDISNGICEVYLLTAAGKKIRLQLFTDQKQDKLWMRLVDDQGKLVNNIFDRVRVLPDPSGKDFPSFKGNEDLTAGKLSFRQILPYQEPEKYDPSNGHPKDKAFRLTAMVSSPLEKTTRINWDGNREGMGFLEGSFAEKDSFIGCISLEEGLNIKVSKELSPSDAITDESFNASLNISTMIWKDYWEKSGVILKDEFLERIWYQNLYFFNCAVTDGVNTPGLFANWSYNNIGTAWHGDYHMNYNTQQPFWLTFSSNHLEKNLSYVNLIEFLYPLSRKWAHEYYNLPGAYFPHCGYPVDMTMNSYPVPHWGWEICETPWAVQGLWWHYLYSGDTDYLKSRAYEPIKAAVEFLVAYMKRPEARGSQWNDTKYHIFPTIPPELYALRPGFKYNYDCTVDLTLVKFIFRAFMNALITVFPGEDHGLSSDTSTLRLLKNTLNNQQNEGGNDLVFRNLQAARIGMLDLEKFKRQINYCLLPNGTAADRAMQVHGRYGDGGDYGFMDNMGIWFENFALPVVVNECLMQSYNGTIRLFPNWPADKDAEFHNLRAAGAFLVSASLKNGKVTLIEIKSEAGARLKIFLPWKTGGTITGDNGKTIVHESYFEADTKKGEKIYLKP